MASADLPINKIILGDCVDALKTLPSQSVDLVFADPPYNLQLTKELLRPNQTPVLAVTDEWDQFENFVEYDRFTLAWLTECRRVLKDTGTIWVIGSYHNMFRVGTILMDSGFWLLNDIHVQLWHKKNPMPNFRGTRFTNSTEMLIWAKKSRGQSITFNYNAMKNLNDDKQMPNVWQLPICTGAERLKINGKKAHSTQKPESLLYRVITASSKPGDIILDPFFGSGTTGAVAKKLQRQYIGIERNPFYVEIAQERLDNTEVDDIDESLLVTRGRRHYPRVSFGKLLEAEYVRPGQMLYTKRRIHQAQIRGDSHLVCNGFTGSIHKVASYVRGRDRVNGWDFWYVEDSDGDLIPINTLREQYRADNGLFEK
jgi:site-specific DNA-methyltransferase (adenine-specific)